MTRRTGKEGIYTRVVQDKRRKLESREERLLRLGFELPSEEQRRHNLEQNLSQFCDTVMIDVDYTPEYRHCHVCKALRHISKMTYYIGSSEDGSGTGSQVEWYECHTHTVEKAIKYEP